MDDDATTVSCMDVEDQTELYYAASYCDTAMDAESEWFLTSLNSNLSRLPVEKQSWAIVKMSAVLHEIEYSPAGK